MDDEWRWVYYIEILTPLIGWYNEDEFKTNDLGNIYFDVYLSSKFLLIKIPIFNFSRTIDFNSFVTFNNI